MKPILGIFLLLTACGAAPEVWVPGASLAGIGTIAVLGRSPVDAMVSLVSGRDCSVVRLEKRQGYCRPIEPPPEEPTFCTHSLGAVNCWRDPAALPGRPTGVADGPNGLTPAQEADRTKGWLF